MIIALTAAFLIAHGLMHLAVWTAPARSSSTEPFAPTQSWALTVAHTPETTARLAAVSLAVTTSLLYVIAATSVAVGSDRWATAAVAAAATGLVLKAIYFHPWLTYAALLDAGVILAVAGNWPASLY